VRFATPLGEQTLATTSGVKAAEQIQLTTGAPCSACKALGVPCAIEGRSVSLRTRRGQTIALVGHGDTALIVRAGLLFLQVTLPGGSRQIVGMYFPGDLLHARFAPPQMEAALGVASTGEIWRLSQVALETLGNSEPEVRRYVDEAVVSRIARQAIHAVTLSQFNCEQRVATLLVELALRTGTNSPGGGFAFEMPFSRKDIADYLGLNPDTVSRIMSRFRASRLIAQAEQSRTVVRDLAALAARSPAASSLREIGCSRRQEVALRAAF